MPPESLYGCDRGFIRELPPEAFMVNSRGDIQKRTRIYSLPERAATAGGEVLQMKRSLCLEPLERACPQFVLTEASFVLPWGKKKPLHVIAGPVSPVGSSEAKRRKQRPQLEP